MEDTYKVMDYFKAGFGQNTISSALNIVQINVQSIATNLPGHGLTPKFAGLVRKELIQVSLE